MAEIGNTNPTILDILKATDPDTKRIGRIIELLMEYNLILEDMTFQEGNLTTGHRSIQRAGLPDVYWRMINQGVPISKATTKQVDDACGVLEGFSRIDEMLAELNGNTADYRLTQDSGFLEAMNNEMAATLFYGGYADLKKFVGLSARYSELSTDKTKAGYNIVNGGGSGSTNTSIWFVTWGPLTTHGIFPKGLNAGFTHDDLGKKLVQDANGDDYMAYVSHYKWNIGLSVPDWRFNARVANIDVTALTDDGSGGAVLNMRMIDAYYKMPPVMPNGRRVIYCNDTIASYLHKQAISKTNVNLTVETVDGQPITKFLGIPVKRAQAILNTEATVA